MKVADIKLEIHKNFEYKSFLFGNMAKKNAIRFFLPMLIFFVKVS